MGDRVRSRGRFWAALLLLWGTAMALSQLSGESAEVVELLGNPSFEDWQDGLPDCWSNVTDPGAALEISPDAMDGAHSIRLLNVRSNDVYIHQNITVPEGLGGNLEFSVFCRIDESEDIDPEGVHSPTGIEVGFEGGDVDGDSFDEYLYFYYFVDDDVRCEDFTVLAGIYNTTEGVDIHKIALLFPLQSRGAWEFHSHNLSQIFQSTLGGFPRGEYKVMVWALRWGDDREEVGVDGLVDGMSVRCAVSERAPTGFLALVLLALALKASGPRVNLLKGSQPGS